MTPVGGAAESGSLSARKPDGFPQNKNRKEKEVGAITNEPTTISIYLLGLHRHLQRQRLERSFCPFFLMGLSL